MDAPGVGTSLGLFALEFVEFGEDVNEDTDMIVLEAAKTGWIVEEDVRVEDVVFASGRGSFEAEFLNCLA